ncbi:hypothetical protein [Cohnella silvisoli]|uniref:NERD domain-containing protein n=1 Tax=Cohnella silvisoli TaxID=2873699 RepID=A0ABV1KPA1_9BACL|nr:hypothetical protein [Cohnella silvisoli]MCD9025594.1 hypothetical protein [Cohnella silvisoli]
MQIDKEFKSLFGGFDIHNPFDTFNHSYDKSRDYETMQNIIGEVKKYDVFDFVARVSALNLLPDNQNKAILLDALVSSLLSLKCNEYTSSNKMSSGKFRSIIYQLDAMDLKRAVDPSENTFVENVMFYDNYLIFSGNNYLPGYSLQKLIHTLYLRKNDFNINFLKTASEMIQFVLTISNRAASGLGYKLENQSRTIQSNIVIPSSDKLNRILEVVVIDNDYIRKSFQDEMIIEELYYKFGNSDIETALSADQQQFFVKPFIKTKDNRSIILNISILSTFVFHKIISLAGKYGCRNELINVYNVAVWRDCIKSLSILEHKKIQEKNWDIDLLVRNYYKEVLLNVCNNQIMIVTFICDDGKEYSEDHIYSMYPSDDSSYEHMDQRMQYLYAKLSLQKISYEDIFHVIIIYSFGRAIQVGMNSRYSYKPLSLNPYDLKCISINEGSNGLFLPRYISAKNKLMDGVPNLFSELNSIEIYVENQYSFYLNDEFNPKKGMLFVAPGDSVDYINRAINKEKRHLVESYQEEFYLEVIQNDETRNIFMDASFNVPKAAHLVKFSNVCIWIFSPEINEYESINVYFLIVDSISYWLAECKKIVECCNFAFDMIKIQIILSGNTSEYYESTELEINLKDELRFSTDDNLITLIWTPNAFRTLSCRDNNVEKQLIGALFDVLRKFTIERSIDITQLSSIFSNPMKKKFITLDYMNNPYLKPLDGNIRKIHSEDENELLDEIGSAILNSGKWTYGIIKDEERLTLANFVVGYLYELLQKQVGELQSMYLVELVCFDLEKVMYDLMLTQNRYACDIACYPEKQGKIFEKFNELNKTSRALKFLAEYIAACPPNGTQILGEWKYEKLLAICSLIIEWAYKNDLFFYKIFNTPVEILISDRVGMKQNEFNKLQLINFKEREMQLKYNSSLDFRDKLPRAEFPNIEEELNVGFLDEYGFSFDDFCNCIFGMLSYGDVITGEVKKANKGQLVLWINENGTDINGEIIEKVLRNISLTKRENYLKPEPPYRAEDVYPWRFNRELSFTRRPVIVREDEVIWGNRQLFHLLRFTVDLIYEGKLKTRKGKLSQLIGKISNRRGDDFNHEVYNKIKEMTGFIVDRNIKKINHKHIADVTGNTLGDIDVLYIIPKRKRIVLVEVKDFNYSKSPYEMDCEYKKMFVDKDNEKSFATKHKKRTKWINDHLEDVKNHYRLTGNGWSVKGIFIVSEPVISNAFYEIGETIITYKDISKERLQKV